MKIPLDIFHVDHSTSLLGYVTGAAISLVGAVTTGAAWMYERLAFVDPQELALQPLHVVLIAFIIALSAFIVLILRAVWGKGLETMDRLAESVNRLVTRIDVLAERDSERQQQLDNMSLDALRDLAASGRLSHKGSKDDA
jgi:hypothetical protein